MTTYSKLKKNPAQPYAEKAAARRLARTKETAALAPAPAPAAAPQPAPKPQQPASAVVEGPLAPKPGTKLAILVELLQRPEGASVHDLAEATDWQLHSVRGALAGALKHRSYDILSEKEGSTRVYRIPTPKTARKGRRS